MFSSSAAAPALSDVIVTWIITLSVSLVRLSSCLHLRGESGQIRTGKDWGGFAKGQGKCVRMCMCVCERVLCPDFVC